MKCSLYASIPDIYFYANAAVFVLTAVMVIVVISVWCIANAKLLSNLLPLLGELLQYR